MQIDREYVEATIENLLQQEREFLDKAHKIRGALILAEALLARLDEKEPQTDVEKGGESPPTP